MGRDELLSLLRAITTDYSTFDYAGEDLVTALWRLSLPHLRYLTIDAISLEAKRAESKEAREDIDRIQGDIESIVAAIYNNAAADEDIVAGVTITREDLEALKEIRKETEEDLDLLDHATARAISDLPADQIARVAIEVEKEDRDALTRETMDILIRILFRETSSRGSKDVIEVVQQLFDSLVLGQRFTHATKLVQQLRARANGAESMQEMHIARHLLRLFASEARVLPVLSALGEGYKMATISEVTEFLRALGGEITPMLLRSLDNLGNPAHRRLICDLIVEFGVPEVGELLEAVKEAKWFVVRDVLALAHQLPPESVSPLIAVSIRHEHPKVRAQAVGMLRGYGRGVADRYLAERIAEDEDLEVRLSAIRVAAARGSVETKPVIERMLGDDNLSDREPREIRMLTAAFAKIAGTDAVPVLDKILNPGFFASLKSTEAQIAAAYALGAVGSESAMMVLQKGTRSLNGKVREAVKKALSRGEGSSDLFAETPESGTRAPTGDLPRRIPNAQTEPEQRTEVVKPPIPEVTTDVDLKKSASGDIDFAVGRKADPLERAPVFEPSVTEAKKPKSVDLHKSGPASPHVERPHLATERMPDRLPGDPPKKTPTKDLPPPERLPSNLPLPPRAVELEPADAELEDIVLSFDDETEPPTDEVKPKSPLTDDLTLE
jgi:HEAT repeat protein